MLFSPKNDLKHLQTAIKSLTTSGRRLIDARAKRRREEDDERNAKLLERLEGLRSAMDRKRAKGKYDVCFICDLLKLLPTEMTEETFRMIVQLTDTHQLDDARAALDAAFDTPDEEFEFDPIEYGRPMTNWNLDGEVRHIACHPANDV